MESQFCNITGADEPVAQYMLKRCNGSLVDAVNLYMTMQENDQLSSLNINDDDDDGITSKATDPSIAVNFTKSKNVTASQSATLPKTRAPKRRLEDIFARPLDISFQGLSLEALRRSGRLEKRWLLVDVHCNTEFPCVVLNRDVWSSPEVRAIIADHFFFWQVTAESFEGRRFVQLYHVNHWPTVSVLDPITGEAIEVWTKIQDHVEFANLVSDFLQRYGNSPADHAEPPAKRRAGIADGSLNEMTSRIHISEDTVKSNSLPDELRHLELSEEDQLKMALEASRETAAAAALARHPDSDPDWEEEEDETSSGVSSDHSLHNTNSGSGKQKKSDSVTESWKQYLGDPDDPPCKLLLRYPKGEKEQLVLPSTSRLKALILYVQSKGYHPNDYEIVANYPRRELSRLKLMTKLESVNLCPHDTVYIQDRC